MAYLADDIVTAVKRLTFLPDASDLSTTDILAMADEEVLSIISDSVKSARTEMWTAHQDYTLSVSQQRYRLPNRALGRIVRGVQIVNTTSNISFVIAQRDLIQGWDALPTAGVTSATYYFDDDYICFPAAPPAGYLMRVWYLRAPSKLILSSSTSCISVLKLSSSTSIQVSADAGATQVKAGVYADVVRGASPYDVMYQDQTVTSTSGAGPYFVNFTGSAFSATDFVDRTTISNERSDYICLRGMSPYAQIPDELFPFLCAAVSRRVLEAIGDREGASVMQNTLDARRREALSLIIPRNEDGSKPIVKKFSPLRSNRGMGRRWR